uniref:Uncharacterized protein n=1 Tax=Oryza glumipatula TaxID=40148 RepID=A0A0D9ZG44_9ORYZ
MVRKKRRGDTLKTAEAGPECSGKPPFLSRRSRFGFNQKSPNLKTRERSQQPPPSPSLGRKP